MTRFLSLFAILALSAVLPSGLALPACNKTRSRGGPSPSFSGLLPSYSGFPPSGGGTPHSYGSPSPSFSGLPPSSSSYPPPTQTGSDASVPPPSSSLPSSTPVSSSTSPAPSSTPPASNTLISSGDIQAFLDAHNTVRSQHGASPLVWNESLAGKAREWAARCVFEHSGGKLGPYGENLAAGTGAYTIAAAVKAWTDEPYDPSNPVPSHFTQVVWKSTTEVGCALQVCNAIFDPSKYGPTTFIVCEYSPAGNVAGQYSKNVQA